MKFLLAVFAIFVFPLCLVSQTFTNYTESEGLVNNAVNCLDVASSDVLWFGTNGGVSVFDGTNWTSHSTSTDSGFVDDVVTAIDVMSNGDVWIGSEFGAAHFDGTSWSTYTTTDGLGNDRVKVIHEDANGVVWFGTSGGISSFDGTTWTSWGSAEGLPFGGVTSIDEQPSGMMYLGTALGGVVIFSNGVSSEITENEGLLNDKVRGLITDAEGNHWIGTSDGVSVYNSANELTGHHTIMYELPPPDTLNPVEDIKIANDGTVWVGVYVDYLVTVGGVAAYNGANWFQFDESDGLVGPVVRQLAIDSEDNCWVATSSGVSKISNVNIGTAITETKHQSISIYPNPTTDVVTINSEVQQVDILDASMRMVRTVRISSTSKTFDVSDLKAGLYFLRSENGVGRLIVR